MDHGGKGYREGRGADGSGGDVGGKGWTEMLLQEEMYAWVSWA